MPLEHILNWLEIRLIMTSKHDLNKWVSLFLLELVALECFLREVSLSLSPFKTKLRRMTMTVIRFYVAITHY